MKSNFRMKLTVSVFSLGVITIFGFQNCSPTSLSARPLQANMSASLDPEPLDPENVHNLNKNSQEFIVLNMQVARFLNDYARICALQIEESHDNCLILKNVIAQGENLIGVMENPSNGIHITIITSMIPAMYEYVREYNPDEGPLSFPIERIQNLIPAQKVFLADLNELNSQCMRGHRVSCEELYKRSEQFLNNFYAMWSSEIPPAFPRPEYDPYHVERREQ